MPADQRDELLRDPAAVKELKSAKYLMMGPGEAGRCRDSHLADALSPSLLKQLLKGEMGAAE